MNLIIELDWQMFRNSRDSGQEDVLFLWLELLLFKTELWYLNDFSTKYSSVFFFLFFIGIDCFKLNKYIF